MRALQPARCSICSMAKPMSARLHRFKKDGVNGARELVVQRLKELGFLIPHVSKNKEGEKVEHDAEPRTIATPFGDRGGVVIEPWLTDQWYVDAETLAQPAIKAVRDGDIEIVPKTWEKTYFNWMENIQPWCVSRQLWWGHRIPAWFDENGKIYVAMDEASAQAQAGANVTLTRDPDVLDTWFSSALWPFGTLGWPEKTKDLERHYPNDLLISGFDILFFWDARMAMQGIKMMGEVPWKRLYLHGLVREVIETQLALDKALADLRFDAAANTIYHFTWDRFCDWYLELIKPVLQGGDASAADETRIVAGWVLDQIIVMLHPFMPFITEELWHSMGDREYDLIVAKWPEPKVEIDKEAKAEVDWLIRLISAIRTAKVELNIPPGTKMSAHVRDGDDALAERIKRQSSALERVGRLESFSFDAAPEGATAQIVVDGATYVLPLAGAVDFEAEKARLSKARDASQKEAKSLAGRLGNPNFVEKAKPEAVEKARADLAEKEAEAERLQEAIDRLG